ncbi:MAG: hypothetical protein ILO68_05435 [Clostridia bacterium]|nr:hypothetical protein [Clostridia bacterium]
MQNSFWKRAFLLALCAALLCSLALTACENQPTAESSEPTAESSTPADTSAPPATSKYQDENNLYTLKNLNMPAFEQVQSEFRVAVTSNEQATTYFSEEIGYDMYETTDLVLNEAVKTRNHLIEQDYGVTIVAVPVKNVEEAVRTDVTTNMGSYDAAMPYMPGCARLALDGILLDLTTFGDYIHLEAPWWDQSANKSLSIGGHLYFTTGDISIMQKITATAITFNKEMYNQSLANDYGDLYQLVRDHKWDLDTMYAMGKAVTQDSDGYPGMTADDTFGLSSSSGDGTVYYLASGEHFAVKDANDLPMLYIGSNENSVKTVQKVLTVLEAGDEWLMNCEEYQGKVDDIWVLSLKIFGENRCLFRTTRFSAIKKLRAYTNASDFGIIPMPMVNADQDTYYTPSASTEAFGICIPTSAPNPKFSAYLIEAMCCLAKNSITPAYYEATLKHRDSKDLESEEMLDKYIFNNVVYDPGIVFSFGGLTYMLNGMITQKSTDIVSTLDAKRGEIDKAIKDFIEAYNKNSN